MPIYQKTKTNFTQWMDNTNCRPTLPVDHIFTWGPSEGTETGQISEKNDCLGMLVYVTYVNSSQPCTKKKLTAQLRIINGQHCHTLQSLNTVLILLPKGKIWLIAL